ncbi:biotin--[acetyl-CoA-carboxylase] ligase [Mariprofundus erugo]|uniref:Bifunctional ligase/repressor BirA n=1 Tax=Mariprofundus erugo TaxID=2528639 RepID=A0A5R9GQA0_9PROT|nr:biotin--[acetyl-CoA-carboxylase] ligase [Mariprofundus erugo]TLS67235.1 biotin--[acetyl-CoA-carboxylase] ligase [Mariprofundus erugo]
MHSSRAYILDRLGNSRLPVSGDQLADELNLSRAAIWKHIQALKKGGAMISAHPGRGYMLEVPVLTEGLLRARLSTRYIGRRLMLVEETGSTNQDVMQLAGQGEAEGLVLIADRQTRGRGRLGRCWHTMPESLAVSALLRPPLPPEQVPQLSLLTAVALHEALHMYAPDIRIKWPNDLLCHGAKLAGILTEMRAEPGCMHAVVLGFGINLRAPENGWPDDIHQAVTDLASASGRVVSRLEVVAAVLNALDRWYELFLQQGFAPVRAAWWQAHAASGQRVRVYDGREYIHGVAAALEADGALLLETNQGTRRIIAGDVELL